MKLELPDGLRDHLKAHSIPQLRRRVYVFVDDQFLHLPDVDYRLTHDELVICWLKTEPKVVTIALPSADERWYYSSASGWGRL